MYILLKSIQRIHLTCPTEATLCTYYFVHCLKFLSKETISKLPVSFSGLEEESPPEGSASSSEELDSEDCWSSDIENSEAEESVLGDS